MAAAAAVALVGIAALVITEREPSNDARINGISMITTAALERAGAVAFATGPTAPQ